ncbi:conserved hypothetical protein [Mesorhizobium sp. SOD10]|nr:conserved hypothetical protein [Mesorhizobium sp. SOD10]
MWCKSHMERKGDERHRNTANQPQSGHDATTFGPEINIAFTDYSRLDAMLSNNSDGTSESGTGTGKMNFWNHIAGYAAAIREFVAPTYRPERYYMRGPGPACARRGNSLGISAN